MAMFDGLLAMALATAAPVPLTELDAAMEQGQARTIAWRGQLLRSSRPLDRALGASIFTLESPAAPERGAALRQAARALPSNVLVQTLWVSATDESSGCTPTDPCPERAEALARAEPDNARGWAYAAVAHFRAGNDRAGDEALHRAASSAYFRQPIAAALSAWLNVLERFPQAPLLPYHAPDRASAPSTEQTRRDTAASLAFMAMFFPIHDLVRRCGSGVDAPESRVADCRAVGERMMAGNSLLEQNMGRALASAAGGGGYPSQAARLGWLQAALVEANPGGTDARYLEDLVSTDSEIRAIELSLQRRGLPLEPPPGWDFEQWMANRQADSAVDITAGAAPSLLPATR